MCNNGDTKDRLWETSLSLSREILPDLYRDDSTDLHLCFLRIPFQSPYFNRRIS